MKNETRSCKNCKFFIQHYARRSTYLQRLDCGHCIIKKRMSAKDLKKFPFDDGCDKWEQAEPKIKTQNEMYRDLEDIHNLLQIIISHIYDSE